jgi:hypothetical protein
MAEDTTNDYWLRRGGVLTDEDLDADAPTGGYSMGKAIRREWLNDHGWIAYAKIGSPAPDDVLVEVLYGDGSVECNWADQLPWFTFGPQGITHYRVSEPVKVRDAKPDSPNDHYRRGDIECIDAIRAALTDEEWRGFCKGNVLKYTWREKHKGGDGSLLKAQDYLRWALAGKAEDKR